MWQLKRLVRLGWAEERTVGTGAYVRTGFAPTEHAADLLRAADTVATP